MLQSFTTSVAKKQIVAVTGLLLIGFILGHLAGNFAIFAGPEALNSYGEKIKALGPLLWAVRIALIFFAVVHIAFTIWVTVENRAARGEDYAIDNNFGRTSWAKKTMIYSGLLIFLFLFLHLSDFTFADKYGEQSVLGDSGESFGLYGIVWNAFLNPLRVFVYILTMIVLGMHLSHGVQSFFQTLGIVGKESLPLLEKVSMALGIIVAVGYSSIPLYVIIRHYTIGPGV